jgi:BirA family transcriptional regulator, biotin operon repressor / biotin---[acetyl-CoA-carboxylase] ligase
MSRRPRSTITPEELLRNWTPRRIGRQIITLAETSSTNTAALDQVTVIGGPDGRQADGLVVIADYQTAGRGRQGRQWLSPRGASVLCSAVLISTDPHGTPSRQASAPESKASSRPGEPDPRRDVALLFAGWLTLASAVAACEAVREATEITPAIKWPNDLRIAGRKLGGILIESHPLPAGGRAWIVGIGINCLQHAGHFPPELRELATSLEIEASHPIDRVEVARSLLRHLDRWLAMSIDPANGPDDTLLVELHSAWEHYAETIGQRVRLRSQGRDYAGRTIAVDPFGGLIVQVDDGKREWFDPLQTTLL